MVWPEDIFFETLPILDTQGACAALSPCAGLRSPHSTREKSELGGTPNPNRSSTIRLGVMNRGKPQT